MDRERIRESIERYVAAWNELDPVRRRELIAHSCSESLVLQTPGRRLHGRGELDALISDFQTRRPGARAAFSSPIDIQGALFRYSGIVESATSENIGDAFDAGECDDDGRIRTLFTFVGGVPPRSGR